MKNQLTHFILMGLILLSLSPAEAEKKEERLVKVLYFKSPTTAPKSAFVYSGGKFLTETPLPKHKFSDAFRIPSGTQELAMLPKQISNSEIPEGAPTVTIPADWQKTLILVAVDRNNEIFPITCKPINASDSVFAPGNVLIINFSEVTLTGQIGDQAVNIKPKEKLILKDPVSDTGIFPTILKMESDQFKGSRNFVKQMWGYDKTKKKFLFILPKAAPSYATYYSASIPDF